jgi:hypothetical protein
VINIYDRIKESSYVIGTGNITLNGALAGFSSFGSVYSNNENLFYAVTNGNFYEIGSGVYLSGIPNQIKRFPFKSNNNNSIINFPEGLKEVYVTYPATHSVYNGSGISNNIIPKASGLSYWASSNMLKYDSKIVWDDINSRLGINKSNPNYAIDIGGNSSYSLIKSSGLLLGSSGIIFPSGNNGDSNYIGGKQLAHYEINRLDDYAYANGKINNLTGSSAVLQLSGVVNEYVLFKKQNAGTVFAGPPSGCTPPCSPGYPSFRPLVAEDIPNLSGIYSSLEVSGVLRNAINNGIALSNNLCCGRLSLRSNNPENLQDSIDINVLYFTPYLGNSISLYNGTRWDVISFSEISLSSSSLIANKNYDIFAYNNNGSLALETSAWSTDSTRTTALSLQNGIYCKSGNLTRRYLGTVRTNGSSNFTDSSSDRLVFNANHRINKNIFNTLSTLTSWTYGSPFFRKIGGSAINFPHLNILSGLQDNLISLRAGVLIAFNQQSVGYYFGIARDQDPYSNPQIDITSRRDINYIPHRLIFNVENVAITGSQMQLVATLEESPAAGYHYYFPVELVNGSTVTLYLNPIDNTYFTGINGSWRC